MAEMAGVPVETPAQRAERLAVQDAARVAAARQAIGEEYYSQFTFRPAINARSRRLAKARNGAALQYTYGIGPSYEQYRSPSCDPSQPSFQPAKLKHSNTLTLTLVQRQP